MPDFLEWTWASCLYGSHLCIGRNLTKIAKIALVVSTFSLVGLTNLVLYQAHAGDSQNEWHEMI